jgi:very-short-patch-repair endonuclease
VPSSQWKYDKAKEMRENPTPAEARMYNLLYDRVVSKYPEHKFYRQSVNYGYILDFYCPTLRLGIEVDGIQHQDQIEYDRRRDSRLARNGIQVYRFQNEDVLHNPEGVVIQLNNIVDQRVQNPPSSGYCFIATAAYGTSTAKELCVLRNFRDTTLTSNPVGRGLTRLYYAVSPPIANIIDCSEKLRAFVRGILNPIIAFLKRKGY